MNKEDYENKINQLVNVDIDTVKKYTVTINEDKPLFSKKDYNI